jgi:xanthine dehydrogenase accessory factor
VGGGIFEYRVIEFAQRAAVDGQPLRMKVHLTRDLGMCCGGEMEVYIEPLQIREPIVIFGAGHIAHAAAPLLQALDYSVTVVDDRADYATETRFEGCEVNCVDPREYAAQLEGGPDQHWLIVTHDHPLDQDLGEILLPKPHAWVGMVGSRAKIAKFRMRYRKAGLDDETIGKLRAPVGLDLGAETPAEIAVSISAELIRLRRRCARTPLPLSTPVSKRTQD